VDRYIEQEAEGCLETALRCMLAGGQSLADLSRRHDVVTGLALPFGHDHLELERISIASAPDLDHIDLLIDQHVQWLIGDRWHLGAYRTT
jgi:hypothetical protein